MHEEAPKGRKDTSDVSDNRPPRMFIADDLGLDFLNSIGTPVDSVVEWIADGEDFLAWLMQAELIAPSQAAAIRANSFPGELDEVAAQARALREWFRDFVIAHMGRPLTAKALNLLEPLNRVLERDEGYGAIMARSDQPKNQKAPFGLEYRALRRGGRQMLYFYQSPRQWLISCRSRSFHNVLALPNPILFLVLGARNERAIKSKAKYSDSSARSGSELKVKTE